jgi:dTDP-4-amino-4,6-dideoxygalactose transaminase
MEKAARLIAERRAAAARYTRLLADVEGLVPPTAGDTGGHSYQSYVVRVTDGGRARRNAVMDALAREDIQTRPGTHAVHRLGYYQSKYGLQANNFPNAALCEDTTITLPIFPGITASDQERVCGLVRSAIETSAKA